MSFVIFHYFFSIFQYFFNFFHYCFNFSLFCSIFSLFFQFFTIFFSIFHFSFQFFAMFFSIFHYFFLIFHYFFNFSLFFQFFIIFAIFHYIFQFFTILFQFLIYMSIFNCFFGQNYFIFLLNLVCFSIRKLRGEQCNYILQTYKKKSLWPVGCHHLRFFKMLKFINKCWKRAPTIFLIWHSRALFYNFKNLQFEASLQELRSRVRAIYFEIWNFSEQETLLSFYEIPTRVKSKKQ